MVVKYALFWGYFSCHFRMLIQVEIFLEKWKYLLQIFIRQKESRKTFVNKDKRLKNSNIKMYCFSSFVGFYYFLSCLTSTLHVKKISWHAINLNHWFNSHIQCRCTYVDGSQHNICMQGVNVYLKKKFHENMECFTLMIWLILLWRS